MSNNNKKIVKKENLINEISEKCKKDFISLEELFKLIDKATDGDGIVSKKKLVKSIRGSHSKMVVKTIYDVLEDSLFEHLSSVNEEQDVCLKLFEGISLEGTYIEEKTKKNNLTGKVNLVPSKIKPKFNITRSYCEKLNSK